MSTSGYQQLPRFLIYFVTHTQGIQCPDDVAAMLASIKKSIKATKPRTTLNRGLTRLQNSRPTCAKQLIQWTCSSAVAKTLRHKGAWWVIPLCIRSFWKLNEGITPHIAFDMHLPGKRTSMYFSRTRDAALLTNLLIKQGKTFEAAIEIGQAFREDCVPKGSEAIPEIRQLLARHADDVGQLETSLVAHLEQKYKRKIHTGD